jgi:hypothetical protein
MGETLGAHYRRIVPDWAAALLFLGAVLGEMAGLAWVLLWPGLELTVAAGAVTVVVGIPGWVFAPGAALELALVFRWGLKDADARAERAAHHEADYRWRLVFH